MTRASKRENPALAAPIPLPRKIAFAIIALVHLLCPLFFYTNLTRNPYYTQIALLYVFVALLGILWAAESWASDVLVLPRVSFEWPLAAFLVVAFISSVWSWKVHTVLRPGIVYETVRVWVFTLVNCVMALYLPVIYTRPLGTEPKKISIWTDLLLAIGWGLLWFGFHANKDPDPARVFWDSYGGFLWVLACLYAVLRTRRGEAIEFFHLIFAVSLLAGLYGMLQYWGHDVIWSSLIMPYGGRPVSTFGNPNFLSSYLMMICPLAFAFAIRASGSQRWGYGLVAMVCAATVICTLTRSSYVGFVVALSVMGALLFPHYRRVAFKTIGTGIVVFAVVLVLFPKTPIFVGQSPLFRFTEIFDALKSGQPYGPWHQRLLIWSSAWDMLQQNRLLGKGWGCFELFYPFFQGKYLYAPVISLFRTHANNAHNILMEIWAQTGMLGTGVALWLFVTMLVGGWKIVTKESEGTGRVVAAALLGAIAGMVADNFFGNVSIFFATPAFLFWWYVGALSNESSKRDDLARPLTAVTRPLLILLSTFCLVVLVYFVKRWEQEIYYFEGFRQAKIGDVPKFVKALEKAYQWFPGEVNSNYEMGNSYARYARMLAEKGLADEAKAYEQKAIDAFVAALHANPGYDEIYFNLGVTLAQAGQRDEGRRNLEMSLYINPLLREAYGALGNLDLQMGDPAAAAHIYERAVEAFPSDKDFLNNLGYCYSQLKESRKSFEAYKRAVELDPSFNQGWQNLGLAARALGETKDPILQVPMLIHEMEGALSRKDYAAALDPARKVAATLPKNPDAHLSLGNIYFYLRKSDEAEKEFKSAIELRPSFVIAHTNLGRLYQVTGKNDLARAKFIEALEIAPDDKEAKAALDSLNRQ